jgi:hypothetical protein
VLVESTAANAASLGRPATINVVDVEGARIIEATMNAFSAKRGNDLGALPLGAAMS